MAAPPHLSPEEERAADALRVIMRSLRMSSARLAKMVPLGEKAIEQRRGRRSRIRIGEIPMFAKALQVPEALFQMTEPEILRWFADRAGRAAGGTLLTYVDKIGQNRPQSAHSVADGAAA